MRAGPSGIVNVEYSTALQTSLEVVDGMAFDRGYLSHHMVRTSIQCTPSWMPCILMTDLKLLNSRTK